MASGSTPEGLPGEAAELPPSLDRPDGRARRGRASSDTTFADQATDELGSSAPAIPDPDRSRADRAARLRAGARSGAAWLAWTLVTVIPVLSAVAWLGLAARTRRGRYLVTAAIYLLWPIVGVLIAAVVSGVFLGRALSLAGGAEDLSSLVLVLVWGAMWSASIWSAQLEWWSRRQSPAATPPADSLTGVAENLLPQSRSYWACLALWALLGWFGAHRFFTGRWISGLFYAATLGLGGAGWGADLFFLRRHLLLAPRVEPPSPTSLAPWASEAHYSWLDFTLRLLYFCLAPFVFVELCVYFHHLELLVALVLVVVSCGLLGNIERVLQRLDLIERIALFRPAAVFFRQLHQFYYHQRPRSFVYYLAQPLIGPVLACFSPAVRRELWLYGKFLLTVFALVAVQQLQSFGTRYRHVLKEDIVWWLLFHIAFTAAVTMFFLVPIITTSFTFHFAGKRQRLKLLSVLVLATTLPITGVSIYAMSRLHMPTLTSWMLFRSRMRSPQFRYELGFESELFLRHHLAQIPPLEETEWQTLHAELTRRYRQHLDHVLQADEAKALQIRAVRGDGDRPGLMVVEHWSLGSMADSRAVFLLTDAGDWHTRWERRPPRADALFAAVEIETPRTVEYRVAERGADDEAKLYLALTLFLWNEAGDLEATGAETHPAYQPRISERLKRALAAQQVADAGDFRVFGWVTPEGTPWLGIRDRRHAWLLVNETGEFVERWNAPGLANESTARRMIMRLEAHDPAQELDFRLAADRELAKDLLRQHSRQFVTEAAEAFAGAPSLDQETLDQVTAAYRDYITGLVPDRQRADFHVEYLPAARPGGVGWIGIRHRDTPLYAGDSQGAFFPDTAGAAAPRELVEQFARGASTITR